MKTIIHRSTLILIACLLASCAGSTSSRVLSNTLSGAGGAIIGNKLSDGDIGWTAAGAAAGILTSESIQHLGNKKNQKAYGTGYDKGRSDAVKQQYWLMVDAQSQEATDAEFTFYQIPAPAHEAAGTSLLPSLQTLRIQD